MLLSSSEQTQVAGKTYPCLKYYDHPNSSFVVLFTDPRSGTVVDPKNSKWSIGYHSSEWHAKSFLPFEGTVTLVSSQGGTC